MIALKIELLNPGDFPSRYSMRRATGTSTTVHAEDDLKRYLELNHYRRIEKDRLRPWDAFIGLWVNDGLASDGDDTEWVRQYLQRKEEGPS